MIYYDLIKEADFFMKKYKEEKKEITEEVLLNFLKEMVKKYNLNKRKYDYFKFKENFLLLSKNKQSYIIISLKKNEENNTKIDFSGYSLETKEQGVKFFEESCKMYEKIDFL